MTGQVFAQLHARMKPVHKILLGIALAVTCLTAFFLLQHYRLRASHSELAEMLPKITTVTVYDVDGDDSPRALMSVPSAEFSVDAFRRACKSATHEIGVTLWRGSSLAVLTLNDGTQRHARFSYYGGFFTVEGVSGRFVVSGGGFSEFQRLHEQLILKEFIPKRAERNKKREASHAPAPRLVAS